MNADSESIYINKEQYIESNGLIGRHPLLVRSLDLNDELGQVSKLTIQSFHNSNHVTFIPELLFVMTCRFPTSSQIRREP